MSGEVSAIDQFASLNVVLALDPVAAATDRDLEHPANFFEEMFVFHGSTTDEALGGCSERIPKFFECPVAL